MNKKVEGCKNEKEKEKVKAGLLERLDLKEVVNKIKKKEGGGMDDLIASSENTENATPNVAESHEESSSAQEDSETETKKLL